MSCNNYFYLFLWFLILPGTLAAQSVLPSGDSHEVYYRILQISGITEDRASWNLRPFLPSNDIQRNHPWQQIYKTEQEPPAGLPFGGRFDLFEPVLFQSFNTSLPRGSQDGAMWQGRGYNLSISTGLQASIGPLYVKFRPVWGVTQNRDFDLEPYPKSAPGASEYAYRYPGRYMIDYVQRYGPDPYTWFDWGDSSVELRHGGLALGFSNQRMWTGPGVHNSLQFGYNAPGFRHVRFGTVRPLTTPIGAFEFSYLFGGMRKSGYYNNRTTNRLQSVNTLTVAYSPAFARGLSFGATRTFFQAWPSSFEEYRAQASKLFETAIRANLPADESGEIVTTGSNQVASLFMRWVHPQSGFEIYFEYGRNDHNVDWRDFRAQPDHLRAWQTGFIKTFDLPHERLLSVGLELTQLEPMRSSLTRGGGYLQGWYTHSSQTLGFTNNGQIPGSGIGPAGNQQMLRTDLFDKRGSLGFKLGRIVYNNSRMDQYFTRYQQANSGDIERWKIRNVELVAGLSATFFLSYGLELSTALEQSLILNHHHLSQNDVWNTHFELIIRKQIEGWLR